MYGYEINMNLFHFHSKVIKRCVKSVKDHTIRSQSIFKLTLSTRTGKLP